MKNQQKMKKNQQKVKKKAIVVNKSNLVDLSRSNVEMKLKLSVLQIK